MIRDILQALVVLLLIALCVMATQANHALTAAIYGVAVGFSTATLLLRLKTG